MTTKFEYYDSGDDSQGGFYGTYWHTQTFTTTVGFTITSVKLLVARVGASGTLTISIKAVDGAGKPTGADLCSKAIDSTVLTTNADVGEWYEFTFTTPYLLSATTMYAIVVRCTGTDNSNRCYWRFDGSSPTYTNGQDLYSSDSGSSWTAFASIDRMFETWGTVINVRSIYLGSDGDFLVAAAETGVYLSVDLGDNWTRKTPDGVEDTDWVKGICSDNGTYIIVVSSANAIYRSANSGTSWGAITPAGGDTFSVNKLATSDDGQFMVIVGKNTTDATESCYISTDYGATWTAKKPITASIEWTECDISNDGTIIAVSTSGYFYISLDSGATWLGQGMASSAEVWECLSISGDGTTGLVANTNDNNEVFLGTNTELYSEATWAETSLTSAGRALLDDADAPAQATTLGLGAGDSPTWVGATFSGLSASRLIWGDGSKALASKDLVDLIAGTENRITVTDDTIGGTTISAPQDLHTDATPEWAGTVIKDSGDNIIFYIDDDEMYFTTGDIPIEAGMIMGPWLFWGTYAAP